jgi:pyridoxine 5-phosphate synthase
MTALSVNVNKLALLRNSRGRNYPDLLHFAAQFIQRGVHGITVHPRPDERHIRFQDVFELSELVRAYPPVEFNVEGFPSEHFLQIVRDARPHQCTLVPDAANQLTSDHGWNLQQHGHWLADIVARIRDMGVRVALFLDPDPEQAEQAAKTGAHRIELYTEGYAAAFGTGEQESVWQRYLATAARAQQAGLGVNAGHDLDLRNLARFLRIPGIEEVSIGHALTVECIEQGMDTVIARYLEICGNSTKAVR